MKLTGPQYQQLRDALIAAFPKPQRLAEVVRFRLDKNLNAIAMGDDLKAIVFRLIEAAEAEGWVDKLIAGARESNPGNPKLVAIALELNLAITLPQPLSARGGYEKLIKKTNPFLDVNRWRERLGEIEGQVCRVEVTKKDNILEFGTGFLIAPNVVITNYHVVESVILEQATSSNVILRFDYKQLGDGKVINPGTEYRLVEDDWLIDQSRYTNNPLPTPDELDYALLRVDGVPGEEPIGKNPDPDSPKRQWIELPQEPYQFVPDTPLFIVQHPKGEPLKLAFDTEAIITIEDNGTMVKYKTNTEPGSSGSPCFDINWNLVALHHSGDPSWKPSYNAGSPFSAICARLEKQGLLTDLRKGEAMW
ncbi:MULTISPECIES: effector-associated domain EAD1-containing protein [unclassified Moorena]|uniref:effector-associated domain EAD1-containing protein n=1 Tax=unclassified Moorena TaxID=2683338 RepID=UPI001400D51A|nr:MULTISPECIES: effector-associated domain EAD1-containing protein [unclassified Moorena]NEO14315.1 trypsin-like peptidase domain-containing protein [Moorena sp. SIO3E8]NEQ00394.1 trypsin-like peptidase domain-containing protein [Moorena sp. SIO3F7]